VVGFTIGSRGKVPGKTCEKRRRNNNNNNNNNNKSKVIPMLEHIPLKTYRGVSDTKLHAFLTSALTACA
jgi:hypothetical protein